MKLYSILYALIFFVFAFLQFNDPDPIFWICTYSLAAIASLLRVFGTYHKKMFMGITVFLLLASLFYVPGFIEYLFQPNKSDIVDGMIRKKPYIEETREFIGLLLAAGSTFHQYKKS